MKVMILAGGFGTRISEESSIRPKPMVEIGTMPIIWHIMKTYAHHGLTDFVICCGYKGHQIKEWFVNYRHHFADLTIDLADNSIEIHDQKVEPWRITLADTGLNTLTGGRIKRAAKYVGDEPFCLTYGDGVADIDIAASIEFHKAHGKLVTMSAIQPEGRFGVFSLSEKSGKVSGFKEKPTDEGTYVNGGYFVVDPKAVDYIADDATSWELAPLQRLSSEGQLMAYRHQGFWMPMDTLRDKNVLEAMWDKDQAPWKCWD